MNDHHYAFRSFLDRAQDESWLASYKWYSAPSLKEMRSEMDSFSGESVTRSHKKGLDGSFTGLCIEAEYGTSLGVDLEQFTDRPLLSDPSWLIHRMGLSRKSTPRDVLEDWACREACFKCLAPDNKGLYLSLFRQEGPGKYAIFMNGEDRYIRTRTFWWEKWVLALAWRLQ